MPLTPQQRKALKAQAHELDPTVLVGGNGLSDAVLKEIDTALRAHELVKIRVAGEDREARGAMLGAICDSVGADPVQSIGRMLVVYRKQPEEDPLTAPRPRRPRGARATKRSFQNRP